MHVLPAVLLAAAAATAPDTGAAARLEAMPDNTWLNLKPKGVAFARMYSGCCFGGGYVWYFGGAHRAYKGNDVQLYDPDANAWIQATEPEWPEVGSQDWKSMISGSTTKHLSPTSRPYTEHSYQQVCWQPGRRRFFVLLTGSGTWEFDPVKREWIHLINRLKDRSEPRGTWAQNHVLYDPTLKAPVLVCGSGNQGIYRFDHEARNWRRLHALPRDLAWNEFYSTWVPDWKQHLISTAKKGFFRFDPITGTLAPVEAPEALKGTQCLAYDSANHVVVALARKQLAKRRVTVVPWALDVGTMAWTALKPSEPWPAGQVTGRWAKLWYDPDHNVHLFVNDVKRDRRETFDGGVTETWAYRFRRAAARMPSRSREMNPHYS